MKVKIKQEDGKTRTIGHIKNEIFIREVRKSKHFYKVLGAWAIDYYAFHDVIKKKAKAIHIIDREEHKKYITGIRNYEEDAECKNHKPCGLQLFLPRKYFICIDN